MWPIFAISFSNEEAMEIIQSSRGIDNDINDEYLCAMRTKSYMDFFVQAQLLVRREQLGPDPTRLSGILLNPDQETITWLLEYTSPTNEPSHSHHDQKSLLSNYFTISAEASDLCTHLITSLIRLKSNYKSINRIINSDESNRLGVMDSDESNRLNSALSNPFSDLDKQEFRRVQEKHSEILKQLRSKRKRLKRRIKVIGFFDEAIWGLRRLGTEYASLGKVVEQLDVAAKGAYILKGGFDTIGRLVERIEDEIEHNRAIIGVCLERGEDRYWLEVLRKYEFGVMKKAEELEEQVYLCLVTINRARAMVVREICRNCTGEEEDSVQ